MESRTFQKDLIKSFNKIIALTNKLLKYNSSRSYYDQIIIISKVPVHEYHSVDISVKRCNQLEIVNLLYVSLYVLLLKKYNNSTTFNVKLLDKRIPVQTCRNICVFLNEDNLNNYCTVKLQYRCDFDYDNNILFNIQTMTAEYCLIDGSCHDLGENNTIINSDLKWYATNCNYKNLDLQNVTQTQLDCNCGVIIKIEI